MYLKPPHSRNIGLDSEQLTTSKDDDYINAESDLKKVREHDLLLLTSEKLDLKGGSDVKKIINPTFMRNLMARSTVMLALVT